MTETIWPLLLYLAGGLVIAVWAAAGAILVLAVPWALSATVRRWLGGGRS